MPPSQLAANILQHIAHLHDDDEKQHQFEVLPMFAVVGNIQH